MKRGSSAGRLAGPCWLMLSVAAAGSAVPHGAVADPAFATILQLPGGIGGYQPEAGVIPGPNGSLYGTADRGGINDGGVVFQLVPPGSAGLPWVEKPIFHFVKLAQGGYPLGLTLSPAGELFGVTLDCGAPQSCVAGQGTVFRLTPPTATIRHWKFSKLYVFSGGDDGAKPSGGLLLDAAGGLTGTTLQGGGGVEQTGNGIVFRLAPPIPGGFDWTETVLHRFSGAPDGAIPDSPLIGAGAKLRYGVTIGGGTGRCSDTGCGTVFKLVAVPGGWSETAIHQFHGGADGATPLDRLAIDANGSLYGATSQGGPSNAGTVYRLDPPGVAGAHWSKVTLYDFGGGSDGSGPQGGVLLDGAGALYGTTDLGGEKGVGTLYKLTPAAPGQPWTKTVLHAFGGGAGDGALPTAAPVWDASGALYGTTVSGGSSGFGTVYRLVP